MPAHTLVVDDDPGALGALSELVEQEGLTISTADCLEEAREEIRKHPPDLILTDVVLPDGSGIDVFNEVERSTPVVLITGMPTLDSAIEGLRLGATDYFTKPIDIARLKTLLADVVRRVTATVAMPWEGSDIWRLGRLVGRSAAMQNVYHLIQRVAATGATVLITGESGTGKELVAESVHALSSRRSGTFLPVNCGAVSASLIESELFGHERGSFTGADRTHRGCFERATGGTLFLDEITEMPIELQVKLLRVLETGRVMRVGSERPVSVDVRVIAATNRRPEEAIAQGQLRADLFYRLNVFPMVLPALRERTGDVELLARHFLHLLNEAAGTRKKLLDGALHQLCKHHWPGNVRELKNMIHRAFILSDDEVGVEAISQATDEPSVSTEGTHVRSVHLKVGTSAHDALCSLTLATLDEFQWDKRRTAEVLGISLKTLYNRLKNYQPAAR